MTEDARSTTPADGLESSSPPLFSVVIPVFNEERFISDCLSSLFASGFYDFEVLVVDDGSRDGSPEAAARFPVRLLRQPENLGPSSARNRGGASARGRYLIFTDADCIFPPDLLEKTAGLLAKEGLPLLGGTYRDKSEDGTLVADFHALRANYYETRKPIADYLAAHYLVIERDLFQRAGGFAVDDVLGRVAACEDLEFSNRLWEMGLPLRVFPELAVGHFFGFGLGKSLRNAFRKSRLWTGYLRGEKRLTSDTGVASSELKAAAVLLLPAAAGVLMLAWSWWGLVPVAAAAAAQAVVNRGLLKFILRHRGFAFAAGAFLYYCYPFAFSAGLGAAAALIDSAAKKGGVGSR